MPEQKTLPSSGRISIGDINRELKTTGTRSLGQADGRELAGVPSGTITLKNYRGKSDTKTISDSISFYYPSKECRECTVYSSIKTYYNVFEFRITGGHGQAHASNNHGDGGAPRHEILYRFGTSGDWHVATRISAAGEHWINWSTGAVFRDTEQPIMQVRLSFYTSMYYHSSDWDREGYGCDDVAYYSLVVRK